MMASDTPTQAPVDHRDATIHSLREQLASASKQIEHRIASARATTVDLAEALEAAKVVIDYSASVLWNSRPEAIAQRPANIDASLRKFRAILTKHQEARDA